MDDHSTTTTTSASESVVDSCSTGNGLIDELTESTEDLLLENLSITLSQLNQRQSEMPTGATLQLGYFTPLPNPRFRHDRGYEIPLLAIE
jgi:hypothetical protein